MGKIITILLLTSALCVAQNVQVRISDGHPQPGDIVYLEFTYPTKPTNIPRSLISYLASIHLVDSYRNGYWYSYIYEVRTFQSGILKLEPFAVQSEGKQIYSPRLNIPIGSISGK